MMTNVQLLLSIGIPSLLIVLSWLNNNSRFERIEKRLDEHDRRFDEHDRRFDDIEKRFGDLRYEMERRFGELKDSSHKDALEIMRNMTELHERVAVVEAKQAR